MDIEKIEKFIDAGYTKEEINKMFSEGNDKAPEGSKPEGSKPEGSKPEGPKPEESNGQGAENLPHDSEIATAEMIRTLTSTVEGLKETVKALQAANVKTADSGGKKPDDEIKSIMDSFISTL